MSVRSLKCHAGLLHRRPQTIPFPHPIKTARKESKIAAQTQREGGKWFTRRDKIQHTSVALSGQWAFSSVAAEPPNKPAGPLMKSLHNHTLVEMCLGCFPKSRSVGWDVYGRKKELVRGSCEADLLVKQTGKREDREKALLGVERHTQLQQVTFRKLNFE